MIPQAFNLWKFLGETMLSNGLISTVITKIIMHASHNILILYILSLNKLFCLIYTLKAHLSLNRKKEKLHPPLSSMNGLTVLLSLPSLSKLSLDLDVVAMKKCTTPSRAIIRYKSQANVPPPFVRPVSLVYFQIKFITELDLNSTLKIMSASQEDLFLFGFPNLTNKS